MPPLSKENVVGWMRTGVVVAGIAGSVIAGGGVASADVSGPDTTLIVIPGGPQVRPSTIYLTPADAGDIVTGINWLYWGTDSAFGYGTETIKNCQPSCAAGGSTSTPVVITLTEPKVFWGRGGRSFTRATVYGVSGSHSVALR
ncbi:hypothetical protein ACFXHA_35475 [Nocardia sp. NPDC059240]|uniref:hypothetical protein n=1 Tax=Nocardia sp. NPDC059240 TaxID=3346786 RepID=UPI00367A5E6D